MLFATSGIAQQVYTIDDVIARAQTQSLAFKFAETRKENKYWSYRTFRANYNPQVRLISNNGGPLYTNSISRVPQPDGSVKYLPVNQFNPGLNLALQQPIQWTGGTISMNSTYNYFNNLSDNAKQWNGSPVFINLSQPLLAYNPYKWDKRIEPIKYEESKREFAQAREQIASDAVNFYFNVLLQQVNLQIANYNLANNDTIYKIEQGRYNIGTTSEDKLLQVELQLLKSKQDAAKARLDLQNASLLLRTYIGLRSGDDFELTLPEIIPSITVEENQALEYARQTRMEYIAFERRKLEAEAAVAQTRGNLYSVQVNASYGLNNVGQQLSDVYKDPTRQQFMNVTFSTPVLDWGRRRAAMQTARANRRLQEYGIAQDQVTFEQQVRTQARQIEMLKLQIEIAKKSDEVALARYKVAQSRYLIGKTDILNLSTALREKDEAKRAYLSALLQYWTAYYDIRRLTLFDFAANKYLYNPFDEE
ncbi:MAG: TolC family protein [Cyclobacteriaceae bacterium]|nr:TolC family protein [Cyclobacteriaceae bacterium]